MNYEQNTIEWCRGDIVIHDADAKEPRMLMRIIGWTRPKDGSQPMAKCQYVDKRRRRTIYPNDIKYLHDPKQFGLNPNWGNHRQDLIEEYQAEWERVRWWNRRFQPGECVRTTSADGGFEDETTNKAYQAVDGSAQICLKRRGTWLLKFVEVVKP